MKQIEERWNNRSYKEKNRTIVEKVIKELQKKNIHYLPNTYLNAGRRVRQVTRSARLTLSPTKYVRLIITVSRA